MRAAVFHGRNDVRIEDVSVPTILPDEVLLKVAAVGICGTDGHEYAHGPILFPIENRHPVSRHQGPMIPGHEIAGVVVEVGSDVRGLVPGSLVVTGAGISCGTCHWCLRGRTNLCAEYVTVGLQRNGGLAQFVAVPAATCIDTAPYGLEPDSAALAQPMSIAVHAMRRGRVEPGDVAVVIGAGGIGAFLTFALAQSRASVIVLDLNPARLEVARRLGADHTLIPGSGESLASVLEANGLVASVVYEVSGSPAGLDLAFGSAPRGCRIVMVGLQGAAVTMNARDVSLREIEVIGTNAHVLRDDLPAALSLLAARTEGWSDIAPVALSLDDLVEVGLKPLANGTGEQIKTLVDPWADSTRPTGRS